MLLCLKVVIPVLRSSCLSVRFLLGGYETTAGTLSLESLTLHNVLVQYRRELWKRKIDDGQDSKPGEMDSACDQM